MTGTKTTWPSPCPEWVGKYAVANKDRLLKVAGYEGPLDIYQTHSQAKNATVRWNINGTVGKCRPVRLVK